MTQEKVEVKEFYTEDIFKSLVKRAEKSKINGFNIPLLTKPELLAVIGDLLDVSEMADERIDELDKIETDYIELNIEVGVLRSKNEQLENHNTELRVELNDYKTQPEQIPSSDDVGVGTVGTLDGKPPVVKPEPKADVRRPIDKPKTQISAEDLNTGHMGSHNYSDWN
jgi:hypothetical protein